MSTRFQEMKELISNSQRRIYYTCKKAIIIGCILPIFAYYFPTIHDKGVIDVLWTSLYWICPIICILSMGVMLLAAWNESKS